MFPPLWLLPCLSCSLQAVCWKDATGRMLSDDDRFGVFDLKNELEKRSLRLGLVIDLTNTTKYYRKQVRLARVVNDMWKELITGLLIIANRV